MQVKIPIAVVNVLRFNMAKGYFSHDGWALKIHVFCSQPFVIFLTANLFSGFKYFRFCIVSEPSIVRFAKLMS